MVASMAENPEVLLPPGFRFHPTDEELILHYLRNQVTSRPCPISIVAEINVYKFDPWDLPAKAAYGDREWYFFSPRDRKYPNGVRPNRAAASGYWKATGTDKPILAAGPRKESIGVKKALVFYKGRPPKGLKTNWIMHEYRLSDGNLAGADRHKRSRDSSMRLDDWVLCRIYKKSNSQPSCSSDRGGDEYSLSEEASFPAGDGDVSAAAKMTKTSSLNDLLDADFSVLSRLLQETPSETASLLERRPLPGQPDLNQYSFLCFGGISAAPSAAIPKLTDPAAMIPPGAVPGYGLMGQRMAPPPEGYGEAGGGGAALECNTQLSPPFLHHRMLMNSRFGLP